MSLIKIQKSQAFQDLLDRINDDFLTSSYQDHFIISLLGVGGTFNNQSLKRQRKTQFFTFNVEGAGVLPRVFMNVINAPANDDGEYSLAGIQFAHYTRVEADYRRYLTIDEKNRLVGRFASGVGKPWSNLEVLPFEKSFFSGGANSVRAWQARTLGPGSYRDTTALVTYNNIGEFKIEANIEYRFDVTPTFEGALFIDAGNIWLLNESSARPGSGLEEDFYSEIAVGGGLGFRLDLDFFLIRLDLGMQLKDPAKIRGERWIWEPKTEYNQFIKKFYPEDPSKTYFPVVNFNLGIGYPF
ncbi:MAG: BamA/TamA family outer membrane protein [Flavobacteriales bacterium]|nr:BamA/TamA family outer membrane protein [Flavobacteriales bacterium]